jgi:type III pantothenate kinase
VLLAVDIGNTHVVAGTFAPDSQPGVDPIVRFRARTLPDATADEVAALCGQLLELHGSSLSEITALVLSSVVPAQADAWREFATRHMRIEPVVVGPGVRTGLRIDVDNPHEVGADRVVNALAAHARYGSACIVVDMGTATTLDAVSSDARYLGGAIAPGLGVSIAALVSRAARLASVDLYVPDHAIGSNTADGMRSGAMLGAIAQLEGLLARFRTELAERGETGSIPAIATGGMSGLIASHVHGLDDVDEHLTLRGLHHVAAGV